MVQPTAVFNVGGTRFEINTELIKQYPFSRLSQLLKESLSYPLSFNNESSLLSQKKEIFLDHNPLAFSVILDYLRYKRLLVPNNVAREVVELQLREFGIPYGNITEETFESSYEEELPSYQAALGGFPAAYRERGSLKDMVFSVSQKRLDSMIQDVILPYLKRHAKRGHRKVAFYLTPHGVNPQTTASDLNYLSGPHEWIYLPSSYPTTNSFSNSLSSSSSSKQDEAKDDDLPDLRFLLQDDNLHKLEDLIIKRSGVKSVIAHQVEVSVRTENEFGLIFTKSLSIVEVFVVIV
ncbi:hypothetical protein G9A89_023875 [Geosiphon pyriformis]|nr:hypothetical protein G9A89_023875 [Geosiphon pyriformis]